LPAPKGIGTVAAKPVRAPAQPGLDPAEIETLRTIPVASLSPDQAIDERHIGKRIRWAGAVQYMAASEKGVCLTILYALGGDHGEPRWTNEPTYQTFNACTTGAYDRELVRESTNLTIVGKISGKTYIGMGGGGSTGPVVEIEKLFRWSDCLEGDTSPVCKFGFLSPKAVPGN
jgi:starvation-inducible outer membrane lipoprotein